MTTTANDRAPRRSHTKNLIGVLIATGLLFGAVQALSPASAAAMIKQETQEECEASGGWWDDGWWDGNFGACIRFDDDSGGGLGGDGGSGGGGSSGGEPGAGDGGSGGGGGFGGGGDDPGSPDGDLKDPLDPGCFSVPTEGGVYEICPIGEPIIIEGEDDPSVIDPAEIPEPPTTVIARGPGGKPSAAQKKSARKAKKARARGRARH
jgi:hypothetical protein